MIIIYKRLCHFHIVCFINWEGKAQKIFNFQNSVKLFGSLLKMLVLVIVISLIFTFGETKMMALLGESYKDCSKGPIKFLDWSEVEFVYENDTTYFINGN